MPPSSTSSPTTPQLAPPPIARLYTATKSLATLFHLGGLYAMAVFTVPLDSTLPSIWPSSIGLMHWLSAPVTIYTGILLHSSTNKTRTARFAGTFASLCYIGFGLASYAVSHTNGWLLRLAVCVQAFPLGISTFFFLCICLS